MAATPCQERVGIGHDNGGRGTDLRFIVQEKPITLVKHSSFYK